MEARLRQSLAYMSDDLRNLTQLDLQESKWPIRKRIFLVLFSLCRSLAEHSEELSRMVESREEEVGEQRTQNLPREQRKESEMYFRAQFVRVVCNGLESIQWPPALEAFADPLVDLLNDRKTFLNSVNYIIKVGGLGGLASQSSTPNERPSTPKSRPSSAIQQHQSPSSAEQRRPTWDSSPAHPSGNNSPSAQDTPMSSGTMEISHISDTSSMRRVYSALGGKAGRVPISASSRNSGLNDGDYDDANDDDGGVGRRVLSHGGDSAENPETIKSLRCALESLQNQNATLSRQLKMAHEATARRERAERSLELIMAQLVQAVGQVASFSGSSGGSSGGGSSGGDDRGQGKDVNNSVITVSSSSYLDEPGTDPSFVTEAEDASFQREVEREEEERADREREKKGLKVGGRGASVYSVPKGKEKVRERDREGGRGKAQTQHSATATTAGQRRVTSSLLWRKTLETVDALQAQWKEAVRDARSSFVEPLSQLRQDSRAFLRRAHEKGGGCGFGASKGGPAVIRIHRLLGVDRPLSFPYSSLREDEDVAAHEGDSSGLWLDLPRVHRLQNDLLAFAEEASAFAKDFTVPARVISKERAARGLGSSPGGGDGGRTSKAATRRSSSKGAKRGSKKRSGGGPRPVGSVFGQGSSVMIMDSTDFSQAGDSVSSPPRDRHRHGDDSDGSSSSSLSDYREGRRGGGSRTRGGPDLLLVAPKDAIAVHYSRTLSERAAQLTMHLSALAPLAPLALHTPHSSSATGLECLLEECNALLDPSTGSGRHINKRSARALLESGDRARSELECLSRSLLEKESELKSYHRLARGMQPVFSTFESNASTILHDSWADVSTVLTAVDEVVRALDSAEGSRVEASASAVACGDMDAKEHSLGRAASFRGGSADGGGVKKRGASSSSGKRGRCALDVLSEGGLGVEVATLVRSLRTHQEALRGLQRSLFGAKKSLHANALKELSALHAAKENLRDKVRQQVERDQVQERVGGPPATTEEEEDEHDLAALSLTSRVAPPAAPRPSSSSSSSQSQSLSVEKARRRGEGRPVQLGDRPPFEV